MSKDGDRDLILNLHLLLMRVVGRPGAFILEGGEILVALGAENRASLIVGGFIDWEEGHVELWAGDLDREYVLGMSEIAPSGDGIRPNFHKVAVTDSGHTVKFGDYEAAADALIEEAMKWPWKVDP